ncbi:hypothetical protein PRZ48_012646 [Zasmidium cellare]|uniref:Uncharacterized protein n=1 Tax=Zasmidium cellare TaxID=395010 RepID=A0ABR0E5R0_ZASCE|nr:hypothetical protein PRZ48_012646 [Zasmidium cellare]
MSLDLAPYNDTMKLGQGFNSYMSYSARLVEKLSDVVEGLNLSYCSSIKKGTVEVSGSTTTVNENAFKSSDLNAVISVKVTNQTLVIEQDASFLPIEHIPVGSNLFNETYGDSYISGFIEGGELTGIISIKVVNRSNVEKSVSKIRSALGSSKNTTQVVYSSADSEWADNLASSLTGIETTVSVAWMGGGQIKPPTTSWDLESVLAAAAAFPANVAQSPQRTWAMLTKYKANRSFVQWAGSSMAKILEYDQINSYSAELFDHYMDYKLLLKQLQYVISHRDDFERKSLTINALDTDVQTLLSVKSALRAEQAKIVLAVEILSKDPDFLRRQSLDNGASRSDQVNSIIREALGPARKFQGQATTASETPKLTQQVLDLLDEGKSGEAKVLLQRLVIDIELDANDGAPATEDPHVDPHRQSEPAFDFATLIPPEIWEDVMPVMKASARARSQGNDTGLAVDVLGRFKLPTPPPEGNAVHINDPIRSADDLQREAAQFKAQRGKFESDLKAANQALADVNAANKALQEKAQKDTNDANAKVTDVSDKFAKQGVMLKSAQDELAANKKASTEQINRIQLLLDQANAHIDNNRELFNQFTIFGADEFQILFLTRMGSTGVTDEEKQEVAMMARGAELQGKFIKGTLYDLWYRRGIRGPAKNVQWQGQMTEPKRLP